MFQEIDSKVPHTLGCLRQLAFVFPLELEMPIVSVIICGFRPGLDGIAVIDSLLHVLREYFMGKDSSKQVRRKRESLRKQRLKEKNERLKSKPNKKSANPLAMGTTDKEVL